MKIETKFMRRLIVRASPTCTLWVHSIYGEYYSFIFNSKWKISRIEIEDGRHE